MTMATITQTAISAAMSPPAMAPPFTPPPEPFETSSVVLPTHTHKTRKPCGGPSEREERHTYRHSSSGHHPVSVLGDNCRQNCHSRDIVCTQVFVLRYPAEYIQHSLPHLSSHISSGTEADQVSSITVHRYNNVPTDYNIEPCVCVHRKKSPTHPGVIHLIMHKDMPKESWEAPSSQVQEAPPHKSAATSNEGDSADEEEDEVLCEEEEDDEEDERELSLSVPTSPTLTRRSPPLPSSSSSLVHTSHRVHRLHSQSFDDIISGINNEQGLPPSTSINTHNHAPSGRNDSMAGYKYINK